MSPCVERSNAEGRRREKMEEIPLYSNYGKARGLYYSFDYQVSLNKLRE